MGDERLQDFVRESDRIINQALDERRAYESNCTCGAVDVEGGMHLDWCEVETDQETTTSSSPGGGE